MREAKVAPEKLADLKTKHFNIWINERTHGYMIITKWNNCIGKLPNLTRKVCYVGVDLSSKIDLTSLNLVFPNINKKYVMLSRSFIPYTKLQERIQNDKMPFDLWVDQGWIIETPGEVIDHNFVIEYGYKWLKDNKYFDEEWCIDPWCANQSSNKLINDRKTVVEVRQGMQTLAEPTRVFREEVYAGNIIHDDNPVLKWAIGNAVVTNIDRNENFLISKKDSTDRIDPLAAGLNAFTRAMACKKTNVYEERGLRSLH